VETLPVNIFGLTFRVPVFQLLDHTWNGWSSAR
jgi:hypothetical protein